MCWRLKVRWKYLLVDCILSAVLMCICLTVSHYLIFDLCINYEKRDLQSSNILLTQILYLLFFLHTHIPGKFLSFLGCNGLDTDTIVWLMNIIYFHLYEWIKKSALKGHLSIFADESSWRPFLWPLCSWSSQNFTHLWACWHFLYNYISDSNNVSWRI